MSTAPAAVRAQLDALLADPAFSSSPRLSAFLRYIVEEHLAGRAGDLKEYQIGVDVFGRPPTFDPKTDPVVRVQARQLRFKLAAYYAGTGAHDALVISVPKGGYAPTCEPRTVPAQQQVTAAAAEATVLPEIQWPRRAWLAAAVTGVLATGVGAWRFTRHTRPQPTLVIAPFANVTGDAANNYLTTGIAEGLTGALARWKSLRVIPAPRAQNATPADLARDIGSHSLLEGSVARNGDTVRITLHLVSTADRALQWTRTWEGPASQILQAETELAHGVAQSLGARAGAARPATADAVAQDLYLRARAEADLFTRASLESAITHYEEALRRDPRYAAAWYGLAVARHRHVVYFGDRQLGKNASIADSYRKAIEFDPEFPDPHTGLALLAMQTDWDWDQAARELATANAIAPTGIAEAHLSYVSLIRGQLDQVRLHARRALDLDPLSPAVAYNTAQILLAARDVAPARATAARLLTQGLNVSAALSLRAMADVYEGRPDEALATIESIRREEREDQDAVPTLQAIAHARAGRRPQALALLPQPLPVRARSSAAQVHAYLGNETAAMELLNRNADDREVGTTLNTFAQAFDGMRSQPAFRQLLKRLRIHPA